MAQKFHSDLKFLGSNNIEISGGIIDNLTGDLVIQNSVDDSDIIFKSDDINLGSGTPTEYFRLDGSTRKVEYSVPLHSTSSAHFEAESGVGIYGGGYGTFSISNQDDSYHTVFGYDGGAFSYIDGQIVLLDYGSGNETTGTAAYNLAVTSDGTLIEVSTTGDSETAERIEVTVKNVSGGSLSKGTVVHAAPTATPPSGNVIEVIAADANVAANMPAIGVLNETIADEAEGAAVMFGAVSGIDTSSFSIGDELYVSTTAGEFTATKPTATTELVQKIAVVIKSHASNGLIKVFGAGRSNDVPNQIERNVNFTDNSQLTFGDSTTPDLRIYHDGGNSVIKDTGTGNLFIMGSSSIRLTNVNATEHYAKFFENGAVELMYDNVKKFETTSTGVKTTGEIVVDGTTAAFANSGITLKRTGVLTGDADILLAGTSGSEALAFRINDSEKVRINNSGQVQLNTYGSGTFTGTATYRLAVDSSGDVIEIPIGDGPVDGSGTANDVVMWSDSDTLTDAPIAISGNHATFAGDIIALGGAFTNPVTIYDLSASENPRLSLGRQAGESLQFDVTDVQGIIRHKQDGDSNADHFLDFEIDSSSTGNKLFRFLTDGNTSETYLTLDSSGATFSGDVYVGSATTNGGVINLIQSTTNPEIRIQSGESGTTAFSIYNTATDPDSEQFFINNTLGTSHLGNKRGALKLETNSGVVLTLSGSNATFAGNISLDTTKYVYWDANNSIGMSYVKSGGNLTLIIDSNNNSSTAYFLIEKDTQTAGSGTELFKIEENANATFAGDITLTGGGTIQTNVSTGGEDIDIKAAGEVRITIDSNQNGGDDQYFKVMKHVSSNLFTVKETGDAEAYGSYRAPIFYDSDDTDYYVNPAAGNTSQSFNTNGIINRSGFQTSGNGDNNILLRAQDYTHWIWQVATTWGIMWAGNDNPRNSYWSTSNPNEIVFIGNGATRASIDLDNGNAYFGGQVRGTIFYDINNTTYYFNGADTSVSAQVAGPIVSTGPTSGTTAANRAFQVNTTTKGALHSDAAAGGTNGSADTAPLVTFSGNTTGAVQGGIYGSQNASTGTTLGFFTTDSYAAGPKQSLTIEDTGNVYVNRGFLQASTSVRAPIFYDSDNPDYYVNPATGSILSGDVVINQASVSYTSNDNTPIVGSNTSNRLHVNGSIQLTNNNDALVIGRGTATFLKDEELGFGWGGGWYMTDGTYLRVRNNKAVYSTGDIYASVFYDSDNTTYYCDPSNAGTSLYMDGGITGNDSQERVKYSVWDSYTYGIGMKNGFDYGHLGSGEYAMSFQMNNNDGRGFWWGDDGHTDDQGAMSLTTNGRLTVATSISVGEGQSVTSPSTSPLYVSGGADITGDITTTGGNIYGKSVNNDHSKLYRFGGLFLTWDSDSYGTNFNHSITSTYNDAYGDNITINSYGRVRINIDSNGNGNDTFEIGRHTTGSANTMLSLNESSQLTVNGDVRSPIFYDSNNTGYYVDPATASGGTSFYTQGDIEQINIANSTWPYLFTTSTASNNNHSGFWISSNGYPDMRLRRENSTVRAKISSWERSFTSFGFTDSTDMRAPIFYDNNDTTYYANFQSLSHIRKIAGTRTNLATSEGWGEINAWNTGTQTGYFGGNFTINGSADENNISWEDGPYGSGISNKKELVWKVRTNATDSGADGGWNKTITGINYDKSHISILYVKRVADGNGNFYHGTTTCLNLSGTTNTNPYFQARGAQDLPLGVWCVSIGFLRANNDTASTSQTSFSGIYRLDTGERIYSATDFRLSASSTSQHRCFLYYATNTNSELWFANPGFYEINGNEPKLSEILMRPEARIDSLRADLDMRAPIFYDSDNTGYYVNPNASSKLVYLGLATDPNTSGSYRLNMGGSIDMNNNSIDYLQQIHFHDNVRFYDDGNDNYLNFKWGDTAHGGIIFRDGDNAIQGYVYGSGSGEFGLLDKDGHWFVYTNGSSSTQLRCDNSVKIQLGTSTTTVQNSVFYVNNTSNHNFGTGGVGNIYVGGNTSGQYFRIHHNNASTYLDAGGAYIYMRSNNGGNTRFRFGAGTDGGTLVASGDIIAYGSPSDITLKENIKPIENALDKVEKLQGVTFDWKEQDITNLKEDIGFIAQDVQKVLPELVRENDNGKLSMRHQGVIPVLVEAIKELKAEIKELKKQIK